MNLCDCHEGHVCLVHELEAEVAALREEVLGLRLLLVERDGLQLRAEDAERELAEAEELLARVLDWERGNHKNPDADYWPPDVDAFLRRREAHGEPCRCVFRRQGGVDPKCELHGDEARRCTCPGYVHEKGDHQPGCELARAEARRCTCDLKMDVCDRHSPYCPARREARRCDCYQSGDMTHARDCPARDEAPTRSSSAGESTPPRR